MTLERRIHDNPVHQDRLIAEALRRLAPKQHSIVNGRPAPPGPNDYDQAEALAAVAIALTLGELIGEVRRLAELVERLDHL